MRVSPGEPQRRQQTKKLLWYTHKFTIFKKNKLTEVMVIAGGDLQCNKVCTFNKVSLHILKTQYIVIGSM